MALKKVQKVYQVKANQYAFNKYSGFYLCGAINPECDCSAVLKVVDSLGVVFKNKTNKHLCSLDFCSYLNRQVFQKVKAGNLVSVLDYDVTWCVSDFGYSDVAYKDRLFEYWLNDHVLFSFWYCLLRECHFETGLLTFSESCTSLEWTDYLFELAARYTHHTRQILRSELKCPTLKPRLSKSYLLELVASRGLECSLPPEIQFKRGLDWSKASKTDIQHYLLDPLYHEFINCSQVYDFEASLEEGEEDTPYIDIQRQDDARELNDPLILKKWYINLGGGQVKLQWLVLEENLSFTAVKLV